MTDAPAKTAATKVKAQGSAAPVATPKPAVPRTKPARAVAAPQPKPAKPAPTPVPATPTATKENTMTDMNQTADTVADKAQAMFAEANDRAKGTMEKGQKLAGEMTDFTKGNVEALVESAKIAARGFETMGQDAAAYARASFERTSATVKQMASVKSPTELMKLQSDFVRTSFDAMVAEGSRSTEAMLKLAGEVAQPISNRMALAAEKVKAAA